MAGMLHWIVLRWVLTSTLLQVGTRVFFLEGGKCVTGVVDGTEAIEVCEVLPALVHSITWSTGLAVCHHLS